MTSPIHWRENLEQARTEAARTGKPVYLDFWAYGCTGCYWMEEATFRDPDVIDYSSSTTMAAPNSQGALTRWNAGAGRPAHARVPAHALSP